MKKGNLKAIAGRGTSKRTLEARVAELELSRKELTNRCVALEGRVGEVFATLREVVAASNNTTLVVSCVERFLDGWFGDDWDVGVRRKATARVGLLKRRKELMIKMQIERKTLKIDERNAIAREIWSIARELDLRAEDVAAVVSLHLQNNDVESALDVVESALDVVEELRRDRVVTSVEIGELLDQLLARCIEVAEKTGNDVLVARVKSISAINSRR